MNVRVEVEEMASEAVNGSAHLFPLALTGAGEEVRIAALRAGKGLTRRLSDLGLPVGSVIRVIQRRPGGAMVVGRDGLRVALGAGMSHKMMVALAATVPADAAA